MAVNCPKCGSANPPDAKFCNQCGTQLHAIPRRRERGQRRRVAVLFSDISGFTQLSERLDPEEVRDLIDACLQRLAAVIYRYEGYIDKFIGDCIMALFGAPVTHEDDPLRAVIAALDQMKEMESFNLEKKLDLSLSVGINYGLVATGDLGRPGEYTVMGDVVNLAQRLQYAAPRGQIYVSEAVYEQTVNEIEFKKLKKIKVKGKKELIAVFNPVDIKRHYSLRSIKELPLIGRHNELEILNTLHDKTRKKSGQIVSVIGEAGIGKSKLTYEFRKNIKGKARIIEGRGIEYLQNSPYLVLKDMVRQAIDIEPGESVKNMLNNIQTFSRTYQDKSVKDMIPFIMYFLDMPLEQDEMDRFSSMKPKNRQRLLLEALVSLFLVMSRSKPLVLVFEDCHWIDTESVEFMRLLGTRISNKSIMVVALYRPEFDIGSHAVKLKHYTQIKLGPLSEEETVILLKGLLHCEDIDRSLVELLMKKSGRIPFYVHELTNNLIHNNIVIIESNIARLKEGMEAAVPRTLDELVMAKVDRLSTELRTIVDVASVIGDEFSKHLLDTLLEMGEHLNRSIASLVTNGMIQPLSSGGRSDEEERFAFSHSLMREAVYQSLLKKTRKAYHRQIGYAIELVFTDHLHEYYDALALHFSEAEEKVKTIEYLERAGDRKAELYMNQPAIELYDKVISLLGDDDRTKKAIIYEKTGNLHNLLGDSKRARKAFKAMYDLSGNNVIMRSSANYALANLLQHQGKFDDALTLLDESRKELKRAKKLDPVMMTDAYAHSLGLECWIYRAQGNIVEAENKGQEAIAIVHKVKDWQGNKALKRTLFSAINNLAVVQVFKGEYETALKLSEQGLALIKDLGDQQALANVYNTMGSIYRQQGKYEKAIEGFTKKLHINKKLGDRRGVGVAYCNLGNAYQNIGEFDKAIEFFNQFLHNAEEGGDKPNMGIANINLGIVHYYIGDDSSSIAFFEKALRYAEEVGDKRSVGIALGNMGEVYASQGNLEKAAELLKKYVQTCTELGDKANIGSACLSLAAVYTEQGAYAEAACNFETVKKVAEDTNNQIALARYYEAFAYFNLKQKKFKEALDAAQASYDLSRETGAQDIHIKSMRHLANALMSREDTAEFDRAKRFFNEAIELVEKTDDQRLCADSYLDYAEFLLHGSPKERKQAIGYLKKALAIYKRLKLTKFIGLVSKKLKK